jgi:hypothetical protein
VGAFPSVGDSAGPTARVTLASRRSWADPGLTPTGPQHGSEDGEAHADSRVCPRG